MEFFWNKRLINFIEWGKIYCERKVIMEIKRDYYLRRLIDAKNDGLIKVITGIRRCGKSYLLNTLFYNYLLQNNVKEDHIIKVALDDSDNEELLNPRNLSKYGK